MPESKESKYTPQLFDAIILGGGASGLFCAAQSAKWGKSVAILDHNQALGKKVKISGGGRCNFTNLTVTAEDYQSQNPHFAKSALSQYTPQDFIELVESYKIKYAEKKLGQLFCVENSTQILDLLFEECKNAGVVILPAAKVGEISQEETGQFTLQTRSQTYLAKNLVIATGGLSFEKLGATDFGYKIARQFGLKVVDPKPALVGLSYNGFADLSGVSLPVVVQLGKKSKQKVFADDLLFTHQGFSGPAILKASLFWERGAAMRINFLPNLNLQGELEQAGQEKGKQTVLKFLTQYLPERMATIWLEKIVRLSKVYVAELSKKEILLLVEALQSWECNPKKTEGFQKAEVTKGGVSTAALSSKTMEAKQVAGLYFIGEVVDVTGLLGGYNFQWAWSSAFAAGDSIALKE